MELLLSSKIELSPLMIKKDRKNYIVEDTLSGNFYEMPKICVDAIELIRSGKTLDEVENQLKYNYPTEDVDIIDFVNQLIEFGLVDKIDGNTMPVHKNNEKPKGFEWLPSSVGRFFFNKISTKIYISIALINAILLISNPVLFPKYNDLFLINSAMINMLIYMTISLILLLIHEFGHVIAMRSFNLPTKLEIGNRFFFVVLETDLSQIWKLNPKERNVLYFAGLSFEQVILFFALLAKLFIPESDGLMVGILSVIIMDLFFKAIYQSTIFMKTDLYYVLENLSGSYNLMENGKNYLKKWIPFMKTDSSTQSFPGEKIYVQIYSVLYALGFLLMIGVLFLFIIPQISTFYTQSVDNLTKPIHSIEFWDGLIFFIQFILFIGLLTYSFIKKYKSNKKVRSL